MPAIYPKKASLSLTSDDETRLQEFAPLFNIEFRQIDEKTYVLSTNDGVRSCNVSLLSLPRKRTADCSWK